METVYLDVPHRNWGVVVFYDFDMLDWDELFVVMISFGMKERDIKHAIQILSGYNTGMTISKESLRMSAVFISKATSASEWWNTALHELKHVADAILDYYNVISDSEDAAYLVGHLTKEIVLQVGEPCA